MVYKEEPQDATPQQSNQGATGIGYTGPALRAKMSVSSVKYVADMEGKISGEEISCHAVYSNEAGSANAQWSKYTPSANLNLLVNNPAAFGKIRPGQFVFIDITITDKDAR